MELNIIQERIETRIKQSQVQLSGDSYICEAQVISDEFKGLNLLARQRLVMATVSDYLESGELHALTIKTFTKEEWQQQLQHGK